MSKVRELMVDLVTKSLEDLESLLSKANITIEENSIGGKVEVKLHESNDEYPKRVLGKSRSDSKITALKAALVEAWATGQNDIRSRFLAAI